MEPLASPDDCLLAEEIAKADPKVREQLKLRGVTDMDLVACDPWSGDATSVQLACCSLHMTEHSAGCCLCLSYWCSWHMISRGHAYDVQGLQVLTGRVSI